MVAYRVNGKSVSREEFMKDARGITAGSLPERRSGCDLWRNAPRDSLSVLPQQAAEANEEARKLGCSGVHFDKDGTLRVSSKKAFVDYYKATGHHNKDAGYGE